MSYEDVISALSGGFGKIANKPFALLNPPFSNHRLNIYTTSMLLDKYKYFSSSTEKIFPSNVNFMTGTGTDSQVNFAILKAVIETAERYSMLTLHDHQFTVATAEELGDKSFDWRSIASCSNSEIERNSGLYSKFNPKGRIRWTKGKTASTNEDVYVPVIMSHNVLPSFPSENFWIPISTGCAAHFDICQAKISAICEVVERDMITNIWLLKLPLKKIVDTHNDLVNFLFQNNISLSDEICSIELFDATSDFGIPVIYGLRSVPNHPTISSIVTCACHPNPVSAVIKVIHEIFSMEQALSLKKDIPRDFCDFGSVDDGARFMARRENYHAFDFLRNVDVFTPLRNIKPFHEFSGEGILSRMISTLEASGHKVSFIDLTASPLRDVGLHVVRAVIPTLMPLSFSYNVRYLETKRLYEVAKLFGLDGFREELINTFPQPFA